jgi:hypothetical protein
MGHEGTKMSKWKAASGSGSSRLNWWVCRNLGNDGNESALDKSGKLRRFSTREKAVAVAAQLNNEAPTGRRFVQIKNLADSALGMPNWDQDTFITSLTKISTLCVTPSFPETARSLIDKQKAKDVVVDDLSRYEIYEAGEYVCPLSNFVARLHRDSDNDACENPVKQLVDALRELMSTQFEDYEEACKVAHELIKKYGSTRSKAAR